MNDRQENFLSMCVATKNTIDANAGVWGGTPGFVTQNSAYNTQLATLQALKTAQAQSILGYATYKGVKENDMIAQTMILVSGLRAHALASGDVILLAEIDFTKTKLEGKRDERVASDCQIVQDRAVIHQAALGGYNVTGVQITEQQTSIGVYSASSQLPTSKEDEKQVYTAGIESTIKQLRATLVILDNIVNTFQPTSPDFYQQYYNSREIVDLGGGGGGGTPPIA